MSSACSCSVCKHGSDLLLRAAVTEPVGRPGPQTHKPEEISVPCQPTASADGTDAFSLLPVDSHSLIFHTKLPTAGLLILCLFIILAFTIKANKVWHVWVLTVGGTVVSVQHAGAEGG